MSKTRQIAVIGMGTFGQETAQSLMAAGIPVCAIDGSAEVIEAVKDMVTTAMIFDSTQEKALEEAEITAMDLVVVAIGASSIENSIMTTALLKQLGVKHITARATSALHARILRQVGADEVVNPEKEMGERLARRIAQPGLLDVVTLPDETCIARIPVPAAFVGHTLAELNVRQNCNLTVLGIERPGAPGNSSKAAANHIIMNIDPKNEKMLSGDILLVMGHDADVNALVEE